MRPIPIPDGWAWPGSKTTVFGPPHGYDAIDGPIRPAEAIIDNGGPDGAARATFVIEIENEDLERINRGERCFFVTYLGHVPPFDFQWPETATETAEERAKKVPEGDGCVQCLAGRHDACTNAMIIEIEGQLVSRHYCPCRLRAHEERTAG